MLAQWTNEAIKGGKQPTPNAVGRYMTKLGWAQQVRRVRGAPRGVSENMWVWEDEVAKATRENGEKATPMRHEKAMRTTDDTIQVTDVFVYNTMTQGYFGRRWAALTGTSEREGGE